MSEQDITELLTYFFEDDADSAGEGDTKESSSETGGGRLKVWPIGDARVMLSPRVLELT